jgi:hypothetical protein
VDLQLRRLPYELPRIAVLSAAGTSDDYKGLWRDVAAWKPAAEGVVLPELVSVATVADFPAGMAKLDRVWDRVKLIRKADWQTPADHPDLVLAQETLVLTQLLRESSSLLSAEHQEDAPGYASGRVGLGVA